MLVPPSCVSPVSHCLSPALVCLVLVFPCTPRRIVMLPCASCVTPSCFLTCSFVFFWFILWALVFFLCVPVSMFCVFSLYLGFGTIGINLPGNLTCLPESSHPHALTVCMFFPVAPLTLSYRKNLVQKMDGWISQINLHTLKMTNSHVFASMPHLAMWTTHMLAKTVKKSDFVCVSSEYASFILVSDVLT